MSRDDGFSLIEIVVAMLLLALMAMAVLPLAIGTMKSSVANRSSVAATAFANATLEGVRAEFPNDGDSSCAAVSGREAVGIHDPAGSSLEASIEVTPDTCPTALPATVTVTVEVREAPDADPLVILATEVVVASS